LLRPADVAAKSNPSSRAQPEPSAGWEQRSTSRVLELRRDQILDRSRKLVEAAYDLLDEAGLEGMTIRAVLKRAGLSRRAFYERFADKDDLMLAVFEQTIRLAATYYSEMVASLSDPLERLRLIVTSIVLGTKTVDDDYSRQSERRGAAMSHEHLRLAESRPLDLQTTLSPLIELISRQLSDGMQAGMVRQADPHRLAVFVYNLVSTTVHTEFLAEEKAQPALPNRARRVQLAADIWEFCRRGIAAQVEK
jgi:AcrR family transcriptional regulator